MSKPLDPSSLSAADAAKLIRDLSSRVEELEREKDLQQESARQAFKSDTTLMERHPHFRTIVNSEPACVKLLDAEGLVISMNPAGLAMVQADSEEELIGCSVYNLIDPNDLEAYKELNHRVFQGESCTLEYGIVGLKGARVRMETHAVPLHDDADQIVAHLGITYDVTDRRRDQEELLRYRDQLEELVAERTQQLERSRETSHRAEHLASLGTLVAGLAHELNNPLGTILLGAELVLESSNDPIIQATLRGVREDVKRCGRIVKSVLQFSRDEPSDKWLTSLNSAAKLARDRTRVIAGKRNVRVELELVDDPKQIIGNETELERVLINLIENAVFASPVNGRVVVRTSMNEGRIRCVVEDFGRGMTPNQKQRAFDPFFTTRMGEGGTGLGLSVSHGIVLDHKGTIEIASTPGVGTQVSVSFAVVGI